MITESLNGARLMFHFFNFLADAITYAYLLVKIYRVLCVSKITFEQFPRINPYVWPFSFIRMATKPYFKFWEKLMPTLKVGSGSFDISGIIGLEMLGTILSVAKHLRALSLVEAEAQRILMENSAKFL